MAKDPAFLFYPGDWQLGTMHLTLLEKGCYIELLVLQFAKGKFTEAQAKHMLNGSFDLAWANIREKFDTDGTFFWNNRLQLEKEKRKKFTDSRKSNGSVKKENKHMLKHMEDENKNTNVLEDRGVGKGWNTRPGEAEMGLELNPVKGGAVVELFGISKNHSLTKKELDGLWSVFKSQNFDGVKYYSTINDVYSHFINWSKTQNINGTHSKNTGTNGTRVTKSTGAELLIADLKNDLNAGGK